MAYHNGAKCMYSIIIDVECFKTDVQKPDFDSVEGGSFTKKYIYSKLGICNYIV